ncbi:MAG: response regulator transcription factor [Solirubrobacteraceae bacterium]
MSSDHVHGSGQPALKVVIVDDHAVVRKGVRALLKPEPEFEVVAEAGNVLEALEAVRACHPELVVLDIHLPGEPSLPAIARMKEISPSTRFLVLTMYDDPIFARHALEAGASGYMLKEAAPIELIRALRAVAAGERYLHPSLGAKLAAGGGDGPELDRLTEREREVLIGVVRGSTNRQIAGQLYLSVRTVETHRARLQEKLGVSGLLELVAFARGHGLIEP